MRRPGRKQSAETRAKISAAMSRPDVQGRRITTLRTNNEIRKGPRWIEDENGCLIWQWGQSAVGYPSQGMRQSIYVFDRGPYRRDMHLNHLCGVRLCVNPEHQVPLTTMQHGGLHAILGRRDWMDLPVPERIELSRRIIEGELARVP